jgi:hypothetical protein
MRRMPLSLTSSTVKRGGEAQPFIGPHSRARSSCRNGAAKSSRTSLKSPACSGARRTSGPRGYRRRVARRQDAFETGVEFARKLPPELSGCHPPSAARADCQARRVGKEAGDGRAAPPSPSTPRPPQALTGHAAAGLPERADKHDQELPMLSGRANRASSYQGRRQHHQRRGQVGPGSRANVQRWPGTDGPC